MIVKVDKNFTPGLIYLKKFRILWKSQRVSTIKLCRSKDTLLVFLEPGFGLCTHPTNRGTPEQGGQS